MIFNEIYGHEKIKEGLSSAIESGRVSHAYIFSGNSGIGKTTIAKAFADKLTGGSCADVIIVTNEHYAVKDKTALSVEAVRAARTDAYTKPYLADKKVFIIPNADTMTAGAQNALLKVLEEPPSYCVIILIAQNENTLLPTIRSRAVSLRFSPLPDRTVGEYLTDKFGKADDIVVRLAGGSIAAAHYLMTQDGITQLIEDFSGIIKSFADGNKTSVYDAISLFEKEKDNYKILLDLMSVMFSNTLLNNSEKNDIIALNGIKTGAAVKVIEDIEKSHRAIQSNRIYGIVISELLLEAWRTLHD